MRWMAVVAGAFFGLCVGLWMLLKMPRLEAMLWPTDFYLREQWFIEMARSHGPEVRGLCLLGMGVCLLLALLNAPRGALWIPIFVGGFTIAYLGESRLGFWMPAIAAVATAALRIHAVAALTAAVALAALIPTSHWDYGSLAWLMKSRSSVEGLTWTVLGGAALAVASQSAIQVWVGRRRSDIVECAVWTLVIVLVATTFLRPSELTRELGLMREPAAEVTYVGILDQPLVHYDGGEWTYYTAANEVRVDAALQSGKLSPHLREQAVRFLVQSAVCDWQPERIYRIWAQQPESYWWTHEDLASAWFNMRSGVVQRFHLDVVGRRASQVVLSPQGATSLSHLYRMCEKWREASAWEAMAVRLGGDAREVRRWIEAHDKELHKATVYGRVRYPAVQPGRVEVRLASGDMRFIEDSLRHSRRDYPATGRPDWNFDAIVPVEPDGRFTFHRVAPGYYTLLFRIDGRYTVAHASGPTKVAVGKDSIDLRPASTVFDLRRQLFLPIIASAADIPACVIRAHAVPPERAASPSPSRPLATIRSGPRMGWQGRSGAVGDPSHPRSPDICVK